MGITTHHWPKGREHSEAVGATFQLWWQWLTSSGTEIGREVCQGRFRLGVKTHLSSKRAVIQWHGLPREVGESPSLEVLQS